MKKSLICKQNLFGGTDLLLSRYEHWLKTNGYIVECVDINNLVPLKDVHWDVVLLPSSEIDQLYTLYKNKITYKKVIVYILGMGTIRDSYFNPKQRLLFNMNKHLSKISNQFLDYLYKKNSIVFTDTVGFYNNFSGTGIKTKENNEDLLIPIGIPISKNEILNVKDKNALRCCWMGRVSKDFKMKSVKSLIIDLDKINKTDKVILTIIGEGDGLNEVENFVNKYELDVEFVNKIEYQRISEYFNQNFDLCIAMGTSALDGAKSGIPTIIISPIREFDIEPANYRWIYESKGYSLGEYVGEKNSTKQIQKNLVTLIEEYKVDPSIGRKCSEYTLNFDENLVFSRLINHNCEFMDSNLFKHARRYYYLKNIKKMIKKVLTRKR